MFKIPIKELKTKQKSKKNRKYLLCRKIFFKKSWKCEMQYKDCNPFNVKHLKYKGNQERYLDYFKKVNQMINYANCWYSSEVKSFRCRGAPPQSFRIESFYITEKTRNVDTFNLMMKERLGESWNYMKFRKESIKKFKFQKATLTGSAENSILSYIIK